MTREQAIVIARECAAAQPEGYMNPDNAAVFEPHEWVITAIMSAGARYENPHADVRALVLDFRDCFLTMVAGYNAVGAYDSAQDAQKMAVSLHKFEEDHPITGLAWPLEVLHDPDVGKGLRTIYESRIAYGEDL